MRMANISAHDLIQRLRALEAIPPATAAPVNTSHSRSPKHPDPEPYTGKKETLDTFLTDIRIKLNLNQDWFATEEARIAYIISRTSEKARR